MIKHFNTALGSASGSGSAKKGGESMSSSSCKKGGNFLGTVGELVAPSGWETFDTTAGLFALDRADAALRRGKKTKSSVKKGGMRGGNEYDDEAVRILENNEEIHKMFKTLYKYAYSNIYSSFLYHDKVAEIIPKIIDQKGILNIGGKRRSIFSFARFVAGHPPHHYPLLDHLQN